MSAFNWLGAVLFVLIGVPLYVLAVEPGWLGKGPATVCFGIAIGGADLAIRRYCLRVRPWDGRRGATFLFLPVWVLGAVWVLLGLCYTLDHAQEAPRSPSSPGSRPEDHPVPAPPHHR